MMMAKVITVEITLILFWYTRSSLLIPLFLLPLLMCWAILDISSLQKDDLSETVFVLLTAIIHLKTLRVNSNQIPTRSTNSKPETSNKRDRKDSTTHD